MNRSSAKSTISSTRSSPLWQECRAASSRAPAEQFVYYCLAWPSVRRHALWGLQTEVVATITRAISHFWEVAKLASAPTENLLQVHVLLEAVRLQQIEFAIRNGQKRSEAGYLTLNGRDVIKDADLRSALLLDWPRSRLIGQIFWRFIAKEEQSTYFFRRKCVRDTGLSQTCELRMVQASGAPFWVRLELSRSDAHGGSGLGVSLSNITESKVIELALKDKARELKELLVKEKRS